MQRPRAHTRTAQAAEMPHACYKCPLLCWAGKKPTGAVCYNKWSQGLCLAQCREDGVGGEGRPTAQGAACTAVVCLLPWEIPDRKEPRDHLGGKPLVLLVPAERDRSYRTNQFRNGEADVGCFRPALHSKLLPKIHNRTSLTKHDGGPHSPSRLPVPAVGQLS